MIYELSQRFFFDAAHTLTRSIDAEGSARIHGHTYNSEVAVQGEANPRSGMVLDLGILRAEIERLRLTLDHQFLDDLVGLGPPTLENLCLYVHHALADAGIRASRVSVWREGIGDRCDLHLD
jgi:6-pyruvoyltetrahydropterin/6-carboxytetrahydropterin synthase